MDVGYSLGVHYVKFLVVEALEGRESLVQEVVDCLVPGGKYEVSLFKFIIPLPIETASKT